MPPDGIAVLPPLSVSNPAEVTTAPVRQHLKTNAVKVEKLTGPIDEEKRKSNFELFAKLNIPSIASLKSKEEKLNEEGESDQRFELRKTEFDAPAFAKAWDDLCARIKEQGKDSLLVTLTRHQYEVDYLTYMITLTIDNKVQEQDLNREKPWILDVLRNQLQNDVLNFEIRFTEQTNKSVPYTQKEKFMKMAEKNPALIYLAEKFKLDL